jgi:ferredoxin
MFKIIHYRTKCIGCGICYEIEPILWRISKKDGKATLLNSESKKEFV